MPRIVLEMRQQRKTARAAANDDYFYADWFHDTILTQDRLLQRYIKHGARATT